MAALPGLARRKVEPQSSFFRLTEGRLVYRGRPEGHLSEPDLVRELKRFKEAFAGEEAAVRKVHSIIASGADLRDMGMVLITQLMCTHPRLTHVDVSSNRVDVEGARVLAFRGLQGCPSIKALLLNDNMLGCDGVLPIAEVVSTHASLTLLDLSENVVAGAGVRALSRALETNTSLRCLKFNDNSAHDAGAKAVVSGLYRNSCCAGRLLTLSLSGNDIGVDGLSAFARLLCDRRRCSLTELDLSDNVFGVIGGRILAQALYHNGSLTDLDLSDNELGDNGASALAEYLRYAHYRDRSGSSSGDGGDTEGAARAEKVGEDCAAGEAGFSKRSKSKGRAVGARGCLATLRLADNRISDSGVAALADAFRVPAAGAPCGGGGGGGGGSRTSSGADAAAIVDTSGCGAAPPLLQLQRSLHFLDLSSNRVTDAGAACLYSAVCSTAVRKHGHTSPFMRPCSVALADNWVDGGMWRGGSSGSADMGVEAGEEEEGIGDLPDTLVADVGGPFDCEEEIQIRRNGRGDCEPGADELRGVHACEGVSALLHLRLVALAATAAEETGSLDTGQDRNAAHADLTGLETGGDSNCDLRVICEPGASTVLGDAAVETRDI